jgi:Cu/Ag efflux protein CusF
MNKFFALFPIVVLAALTPPVSAQQRAMGDAKGAAEAVTITAKVEAVDLPNRVVTVRGPLGRSVALKVDERVKNLPQVKVGDELVFKYLEAVSIALKKGSTGRSETTTSTGPMTAAPGAKPGMAAATQTTIVAKVDKVDAARNVVLLQGPQGRYVEVKVKDPAVMKEVKEGDSVEATFTEAVVLEVVGPAKK